MAAAAAATASLSSLVAVQAPAALCPVLFGAYCDGLNEPEAARCLLRAQRLGDDALPFAHADAVESYRLYGRLQQALLADPGALLDGAAAPLLTYGHRDLLRALHMLFTPNLAVWRALLGRQLTSKTRAQLDDVADEARLPLREATRVFDVLRAVVSHVGDADAPPPLLPTLRRFYRLGPELAWLYACIVFLLSHRCAPGDGRAGSRAAAAAVPTETLLDCASAMLLCWSEQPPGAAGAAAPLAALGAPRRAPLLHPPSQQQLQLLPSRTAPGMELCALITASPAAGPPTAGGGGAAWQPSACTTTALCPQLLASLRESTGRMLRTKGDRTAAGAAVTQGFLEALLAPEGDGGGAPPPPGADSGGTPAGSPVSDDGASSLYGGRFGPNNSASGPAAAAAALTLARRLESRLPALLLALRDLAGGLGGAGGVRDLFDELAAKVAAPLSEVPLGRREAGALFGALRSPAALGALLVGPPEGPHALHWRRFVAVVAYIVERLLLGGSS